MQIDWGSHYLIVAVRWLDPLLQLIGLGISIWAYRVSRKAGYLIVAAYFFLAACSLTVIPKIRHALYQRRHPPIEISREMQEKYASELMALSQKYYPSDLRPVERLNINFPLGSILLITGIWLLAKDEAKRSAVR
jgi:hypothetical protein